MTDEFTRALAEAICYAFDERWHPDKIAGLDLKHMCMGDRADIDWPPGAAVYLARTAIRHIDWDTLPDMIRETWEAAALDAETYG